jgi:hypothetical protein
LGAVGGLLGVSGGANGTGFASPSTGNIVTPGQLSAANTSANNALAQQQAFTAALNPAGTQGLVAQGQLLGQLQQGAAGTGPNPALAQLNQTTGQNVANQAALMAGQRGANQNAGLIARQAAQQGAATQQQAAGQAATQQAQQQIAYQQALGNQANTMVGQAQGANQAQTQNALNQQLGLSSTAAGLQQSVNQGNAALAGQQMGNQAGLLGGLAGGLGASGILGSGIASYAGAASGGKVSELPKFAFGTPSGTYDNNFQPLTDAQYAGQAPLPVPGPAPAPVQAPAAISVTPAAPTSPATPAKPVSGPTSSFGRFLSGATQSPSPQQPSIGNAGNQIGRAFGKGIGSMFASSPNQNTGIGERDSSDPTAQYVGANAELGSGGDQEEQAADNDTTPTMAAAQGGKVPALVSPGERYLNPKEVAKVAKGEKDPMEAGEKIPGKPKVGGAKNSYANDTVKKTLDEGGIVLPRSVTQAKHPHWEAHKFVSAIMAKNGGKIK